MNRKKSNFPFLAMVLPAMAVSFQSFFIEKVFRKYTPAEEAETSE